MRRYDKAMMSRVRFSCPPHLRRRVQNVTNERFTDEDAYFADNNLSAGIQRDARNYGRHDLRQSRPWTLLLEPSV